MPGSAKFFDVGRRRDLLGVLVSLLVVLVAFYPVVVGGRTFDQSTVVAGVNGPNPPAGVRAPHVTEDTFPDPAATAWQTIAWGRVVHRELVHGHWPFWNPDEGIGEPLAGNLQSAAFDPLLLPFFVHPTSAMWDLCLLLSFLLGAGAMYFFLRRRGLGLLAAVAGSAAFSMCGYFALNTPDAFVRVYVYLPVLFLAVDGAVRSRRTGWIAGLAAGVAGCILAGMAESTVFVLLAVGIYAVYRVAIEPGRVAAAVRLGIGGLLGLCLASPVLIAFLQYLPNSYNTHSPGVGEVTGAFGALLFWLMPYVNGYTHLARVGGIGSDRGWVGMAAGALAAAAAAAPSAMRRAGGWFFLGLAAVVLLKDHGVGALAWLGRLPLLSQANFPAFSPPLAEFGLAVCAAIGIDAMVTGAVRRRNAAIVGVLAALALAVLVFANRREFGLDAASVRTSLLAAAAGIGVVGAVIVVLRRSATARSRSIAATVALVVMAGELFAVLPHSSYPPRADAYRHPAWLGAIPSSARVLGLDELLYPNTAGALGLDAITTLNGLYVARYRTFIREFVTTTFDSSFTGDNVGNDQVRGNPMFDLLGVRYIVADPGTGLATPPPGAPAQYRSLGVTGGVEILQNQAAFPRAFVVQDVTSVRTEAAAIAALHQPGFDPATQAVVESGGPRAASSPSAPSGPSGPSGPSPRTARIASYSPEGVTVDVGAGSAGVLVLSDAYYPGWEATVNGRPAAILPTDVALRGVRVGSGASRVVFRYVSPGGVLDLAVPAAAVLVVVGLLAIDPGRRRRTA